MKNLTERNFKILIRVSSGVLIGIILILIANVSQLALIATGVALIFAIGDKYFAKELTWLEVTMKEQTKLTFAEDEPKADVVEEAPKKAPRKAKLKKENEDENEKSE